MISILYIGEPYAHKLTLLTMKQKHNNLTMGLVKFFRVANHYMLIT